MTKNERSLFYYRIDMYDQNTNSIQISPPNLLNCFELQLIKWSWNDISRNRDGSITKQILVPGEGHTNPTGISIVDIHLKKEQKGILVQEMDIKFRLGTGENYNIPHSIEQALTTFTLNEKSRLFIHEKQNVWGEPELVEEYVITLNYFEQVRINNIYIFHFIIINFKFFYNIFVVTIRKLYYLCES